MDREAARSKQVASRGRGKERLQDSMKAAKKQEGRGREGEKGKEMSRRGEGRRKG